MSLSRAPASGRSRSAAISRATAQKFKCSSGRWREATRWSATGLVLQEILQGFAGTKSREQIIERFSALPLIVPDRDDHIEAAELRNHCRRKGVQIGTIDALLAQLCLHHGLTMLTTDNDFRRVAEHAALKVWLPEGG